MLESLQLLFRILVFLKKIDFKILEDNNYKFDAPSDENTKKVQNFIESINRLYIFNEVLIGNLFSYLVVYKSV